MKGLPLLSSLRVQTLAFSILALPADKLVTKIMMITAWTQFLLRFFRPLGFLLRCSTDKSHKQKIKTTKYKQNNKQKKISKLNSLAKKEMKIIQKKLFQASILCVSNLQSIHVDAYSGAKCSILLSTKMVKKKIQDNLKNGHTILSS